MLRDKEVSELINLTSQQLLALSANSDVCPVCSGHLDEEHKQKCKSTSEVLASKVDKLKKSIAEYDKKISDEEKLKVTITNKITDVMQELQTYLNQESEIMHSTYGPRIVNMVDSDLLNFQTHLKALREKLADIVNNNQKIEHLEHLYDAQVESCTNYKEQIKEILNKLEENGVSIYKTLEDYGNLCSEAKTKLDELNKLSTSINNLISSRDSYDAMLTKYSHEYCTYHGKLEMLQEQFPDIDLNITDEGLEVLTETYRELATEYVSLSNLIRQAETELSEVRHKLKECRDNIETNNKKLQLIEDLQAVINVTCKNGVPLAYANEVFAKITPMVQEMLERMQANFTVAIDPERPMTYKFTRTDNDSGYAMPQERLSGGQAIRLAIALLIACQQTILPEVGLLILDEPSSHIDSEGVEHMRDMFIQLEDILKNSNMQVILVDHNPTLVAAFDKTIKL
jgi:DNA repair exonuclease SbcCD ATPase subunit